MYELWELSWVIHEVWSNLSLDGQIGVVKPTHNVFDYNTNIKTKQQFSSGATKGTD